MTSASTTRTWLLVLAFAAIYLIWGSTYLAIRFAVETMPPLLVAGFRFLIAGACVLTWSLASGAQRPSWHQCWQAVQIGTFLLVGGNGLVCWSEQTVPSGVTALIIATTPLWMVTLDVMLFRARRLTTPLVWGLLLGLSGVIVLLGRDQLLGQPIDGWGAMGLVAACCLWALGSLRARQADLPKSPFVTSGLEMFAAGVILLALAWPLGNWNRLQFDQVTHASWWSLAYLIVFGSIVAFSAYAWLLKTCDAALVFTYAYINPIVAVTLGAALGGERISPRIAAGAVLVLAAVVLLASGKHGGR